jgi:ABC-type uncharacterized transport system permease subunit
MLRALAFVAAAAAGYVLMRAAWIFVGWPGVVAVVLLVVALAVWRRGQWPLAAGLSAGAAVSAVALTL